MGRKFKDISNKEKQKILDDFKAGKSITKISKEIDLNTTAISNFLKKNNINTLSSKGCKISEEVNQKSKELYEQGFSIAEIARILNVSQIPLSKRLKSYGYKVLPDGKKSIDSHIFDVIDTEEKAYWLGFLMADGFVSDNNRVELQIKDKEHIEEFKRFLQSKHKISERHIILDDKEFVSYRISFQDKNIAEKLKSYGCIPRKTFEMHIPNINDELFKHWLRGYFDGDGCIYYYSQYKHRKGAWRINISSGNQEILNEIVDKLNSLINFKNLKIVHNRTCYNIVAVNIYDTATLLDYMYKDITIALKRKYELYTQYCRLETRVKK